MGRIKLRLLAAGVLAAAVISAPAAAQEKVQGIVVTNKDGMLTVKTPGGDQNIRMSNDVRVRSISGGLGGDKDVMPVTSLIPGLPVTIEMDGGMATKIDYKAKDYKTAAQIQAGVQETARREAELRNAYGKVGEWDIRAETTVYFKTGSAVISPEGKRELITLAKKAKTHKGYVISVLGYADPTGNAEANERLSQRRAQTVINYLKQSGEVLPGRVMAASAMGEVAGTAAPDPASYASARRVTARVLTSKAMLNQ